MSHETLNNAARVSHTDASDYLISRKWIRAISLRGYAAIYRSPGTADNRQEVHVPLERDLGDYAEAMLEVARGVARYEGREILDVLRDLTRPRVDTLRFALEGTRMTSGTVRLNEGVALVAGAKKALMASACTVRQPRKYHPRMSIAEAEAYVQGCRLGQTEIGSFVLTIEAPIHTDDQPDDDFGRQASMVLMKASSKLASAIRARDTESLFGEQATLVSSNLCSALLEMMPADEGSDLRLAGTWSPIVAPPSETPAQVTFDRDMFEDVERVALRLRAAQIPLQDRFFGTVIELAGVPTADGTQGEVVVRLFVDEESIKAKLTLGRDDYTKACGAHLAQDFVSVFGSLHRGSRAHHLSDPSEFTVHEKKVAGP